MKSAPLWRCAFAMPFAILSMSFATPCSAHPADISHLKVKIEPQRIEFRLTFNLYTLQQFHLLDADRDDILTKTELDAGEKPLRDYITEHVLITINGEDSDLGEAKKMERMWPVESAGAGIQAPDFAQRFVDFIFIKTTQHVVDEVWLGFNIFEETGELHVVQGVFEQDGKPAEVTFDRNEPEYAWATGFPEMPGLKAEPAASTETPNAPQNRGIHPLVLVIGIAAFAATWLLLRKVKRISRGAFNIGPRE